MAYRRTSRASVSVNATTPTLICAASSPSAPRAGVRIYNNAAATLQLKYSETGAALVAGDFNGTLGYPDFENITTGAVFEDGNQEQDLYCMTTGGTVTINVQRVIL
jgi:hypothetical protein